MLAFIIAIRHCWTKKKTLSNCFHQNWYLLQEFMAQSQRWFPLIYSLQMCRAFNLLQTALVLHLGCNHYSQYDSALCRISFLNARCDDYASDPEKGGRRKRGKEREWWRKTERLKRRHNQKRICGTAIKKPWILPSPVCRDRKSLIWERKAKEEEFF